MLDDRVGHPDQPPAIDRDMHINVNAVSQTERSFAQLHVLNLTR